MEPPPHPDQHAAPACPGRPRESSLAPVPCERHAVRLASASTTPDPALAVAMGPHKEKTLKVGAYTAVLSEPIGSGATSVVYKGHQRGKGKAPVAIKAVSTAHMSKKQLEALEAEVDLARLLQHERLVRCLDSHQAGKHMYLVMEYCEGGSLAQLVKRHPPAPPCPPIPACLSSAAPVPWPA
eukprot:gene6949-6610_t